MVFKTEKKGIFKCEILTTDKGNWNRDSSVPYICLGKTLLLVKIDSIEYCFRHKEIIDIIRGLHEVDLINIKAIKDPNIDTGVVDKIERPWLELLEDEVKKLKKFITREERRPPMISTGEFMENRKEQKLNDINII